MTQKTEIDNLIATRDKLLEYLAKNARQTNNTAIVEWLASVREEIDEKAKEFESTTE
jgi:hypothetical protein